MKFDIITIFPNILDSYFNESILRRAKEAKLIQINVHNLRDYTKDKHHKVDDSPYGGGPGMVFKVEPVRRAVEDIKYQLRRSLAGEVEVPTSNKINSASEASDKKFKTRTILFSLRGKKFDQKTAHRLAKYNQLIFICGRYEGIDERVAQYIADEEICIGDFVLSGGELPAATVVEAVSRLVPGVLGKTESLEEIKGTYPVYTKPEEELINGKKRTVPKVLLSGNHKDIEEWRNRHS